MAFRTYFTKEISDKFKMPHKLDQDNDSMSKRLMGALAVIDQFCKDEHEQKEWLKNNAKVEVQRLYIDYKLPMLGKTLYDQACQQIVNIKVHLKTPTVLADVDSFLKQLYNVYFQKVH